MAVKLTLTSTSLGSPVARIGVLRYSGLRPPLDFRTSDLLSWLPLSRKSFGSTYSKLGPRRFANSSSGSVNDILDGGGSGGAVRDLVRVSRQDVGEEQCARKQVGDD